MIFLFGFNGKWYGAGGTFNRMGQKPQKSTGGKPTPLATREPSPFATGALTAR
jgi:hypothetical protein